MAVVPRPEGLRPTRIDPVVLDAAHGLRSGWHWERYRPAMQPPQCEYECETCAGDDGHTDQGNVRTAPG